MSDALPAPALGLMPAPSIFFVNGGVRRRLLVGVAPPDLLAVAKLLTMSVLVCAVHGITVALKETMKCQGQGSGGLVVWQNGEAG